MFPPTGVGERRKVDAAKDDPDDSENCDPSPDDGPSHARVASMSINESGPLDSPNTFS